MRQRGSFVAAAVAVSFVLAVGGCDIFGPDSGACVSEPVQYTFGLRVYCYSDWTEDECSENDSQKVNGAGWTHYGGADVRGSRPGRRQQSLAVVRRRRAGERPPCLKRSARFRAQRPLYFCAL